MCHTVVTAHQENAIVCLSLLKDFAEKTASFRRVISQVLVDPSYIGGRASILDNFFTRDSSLWICKHVTFGVFKRLLGVLLYVYSGKDILAPIGNEECFYGPKSEEGNGHFTVYQLF